MNRIRIWNRMMRHYLSRFGLEIIGCWLASAAAAAATALGAGDAMCLSLARLETVAALWITVRILMAEFWFSTTGGWQARPLPRGTVHFTRHVLACGAVTIAQAIKVATVAIVWHPDGTGWTRLFLDTWVPQAIGWVALAGTLEWVSWRSLKRGVPWSASWKASGLAALLALTFGLCAYRQSPNRTESVSIGTNRGRNGAAELFPLAPYILGLGGQTAPGHEFTRFQIALRVPLTTPPDRLANGRINHVSAAPKGSGTFVSLDVTGVRGCLWDRMSAGPAVIRYADGSIGAALSEHAAMRGGNAPTLWPMGERIHFEEYFASPMCLPTYRHGIDPLPIPVELCFLMKSGAALAPERPVFSRADAPETPLEKEVRDLLDAAASTDAHGAIKLAMRAKRLPKEAVAISLKRQPWTDSEWTNVAKPLLESRADRTDIPELLRILTYDARVGSIFVAKGWGPDALPRLREWAYDRLPLDLACIALLCDENDPSLSDPIVSLALGWIENPSVTDFVLGQKPGFDRTSWIKRGWLLTKYRMEPSSDSYRFFSREAAKIGDRTALLAIAEGPMLETDDRGGILQGMLAHPVESPSLWLRMHQDRIEYDAKTAKWRIK